jgi:uncharacterized integral membrane protein
MLGKISLVLKKIAYFLVFLFLLVFIFSNTDFVRVSLPPFGYEMKIRIFFLIIMSFFLGSLFGYFLNVFNIGKAIKRIGEKKKIKNMEKELENVKNANEEKN